MPGQAQIKHIRALQQKKFRMLHGSFVVEGEKIVSELLRSDYSISGIYALQEWMESNRSVLPAGVPAHVISEKDLSRISGLSSPNKVVAVADIPAQQALTPEGWNGLALYLDCIQDPGNLGTIIRTADWFGVEHVFCSPDTAELYNPKVLQATMGSFLRVRVSGTDLPGLLQNIDIKPVVYGAALNGDNIFHLKPEGPALMIIGNESKGMAKHLDQFVDRRVMIPGRHTGADSLNASVASGIIMAWFFASQDNSR